MDEKLKDLFRQYQELCLYVERMNLLEVLYLRKVQLTDALYDDC